MPLPQGTLIVDRFEIVQPLGAGSMGEVYQAHDRKLHRDVAVKILSASLATSQEHLLRFEREARAASALNHPHICTIYDVGQAPEVNGRPYLVMELLRGTTLFETLLTGGLPAPQVISIGVQIADALDIAHSAGIIHRDLKPANIFLTARGDAKLLDFGLAAITERADEPTLSSDANRPALLTSPGTAVGTVLYMSPEQALGDPLDTRTDIFSFGLVLYEMLTGHRAFEGRSTTAIVDAILHSVPVGLDAAADSPIPKPLRRLIAAMLDKDKDRRPSTAAEVSAHLRAVQSGSFAGREYAAAPQIGASSVGLNVGSEIYHKAPTFEPAAAVSSGLNSALSGGTLRDAVTISAAIVIIALAGYGAFRWAQKPAPLSYGVREPLLIADFVNSTGETVFDGTLKDALEIQLQQSPYVNVVPASQVRTALQRMERPPDERITPAVARDVCQRLGVKAVMLGSIAPLGNSFVTTLEAQTCRTGDTLAREQAQAPSKTEVLAAVGAAASRIRERLGESLGSIQRFNVPAQDATTPSIEALKAYSLGVETRVRTGEVQAIPFFKRALELDPNFALAAARLGAIYTNLSELGQAQDYMKRAFARSGALSEPERLFIRSHYHFIVTGKLDEVAAAYQLWIGTYPSDWIPHNNLSATYLRLGQVDESLAEARTAVRLGSNSVVPYQQLTRTLLEMERLGDAKQALRDAETRGLESSSLHALAFDIAFIDGDTAGMDAHLQSAQARPDGYIVVTEAARAAFAAGQIERGRTLYAQATESARATHVDESVATLYAEQALNDALTGDQSRARDEIQKALATSSGIETTRNAALAAAFAGQSTRASQLAAAYEKAAPPAPDIVNGPITALHAAAALAANEPKRALDALNRASGFERVAGVWLPYLRGLAYGALHDDVAATAEFEKVVARKGVEPTSPLRLLARREIAKRRHE